MFVLTKSVWPLKSSVSVLFEDESAAFFFFFFFCLSVKNRQWLSEFEDKMSQLMRLWY